jgi:hypothetical protein
MGIWTDYVKLSDETGRDRLALDCRHSHIIQDLETALLLQVAGEILLMDPLHDYDDPRLGLVIAARKQGGPVPFEDALAHRFGHDVAELNGVRAEACGGEPSAIPAPLKSRPGWKFAGGVLFVLRDAVFYVARPKAVRRSQLDKSRP